MASNEALLLKEQYDYVREAREVLFQYCSTISGEDFIKENESFGRGGSIRNLLVHIANTYQFWIGKYGLNAPVVFTTYDFIKSMPEMAELFSEVDDMMNQYIALDRPVSQMIPFTINCTTSHASVFKLFSHVITHEFHHKGQILSISRKLGYIPIDTDIMR